MDEIYVLIGEQEKEQEEFVKAAAELAIWSGGGISYADVMRMTASEMRIVAERLGNKMKVIGKATAAGSPAAGML